MELTFFKLEVKMVFSQPLQDLCDMLVMLGLVPGVDENIVDVDDDELVEEFPEQLIHVPLEYGR